MTRTAGSSRSASFEGTEDPKPRPHSGRDSADKARVTAMRADLVSRQASLKGGGYFNDGMSVFVIALQPIVKQSQLLEQ